MQVSGISWKSPFSGENVIMGLGEASGRGFEWLVTT